MTLHTLHDVIQVIGMPALSPTMEVGTIVSWLKVSACVSSLVMCVLLSHSCCSSGSRVAVVVAVVVEKSSSDCSGSREE
jgi:hypothetical protein